MKSFSLILILLPFTLFSQLTLKQIDKKLDSLQTAKLNTQQRIAAYQEQLKNINKEIEELKNQKSYLMAQSTNEYFIGKTSSGGAILRDKPSVLGKEIITIPPHTEIKVYKEHDNLYLKASYNNLEGYVNYSTLEPNKEIDDFLAGKDTPSYKNNTENKTIIRNINEKDPKFQKLSKLYGRDIAIRIMNKEVWEGMSPGMLIESIGNPNQKTSLQTNEGIKENWEYNDYTIVLFNGSVSKIIKK